jgi:hypothetical protein
LSRHYLTICRGELGEPGIDGKFIQYSKDFKGMEWGCGLESGKERRRIRWKRRIR